MSWRILQQLLIVTGIGAVIGFVVSVGDDRQPLCGVNSNQVCGRFLNFYGRVTVIRLDQKYRGQTLFALHGHQDRIDVQVGQRVKRGLLSARASR